MNDISTRDRILNSAEKLFSSKGYEGTSMRMITSDAGVNLAAVNYHFGSKEELTRCVFRRWLTPINEVRIQFLNDIRERALETGEKPDISEILRGLLVSTIEYATKDEIARNFPRLIGRSIMEPSGVLRNAFIECVNPLMELIIDTIKLALPNLSREIIWIRFHLAVGAMGKAIMEFSINKDKNWIKDIEVNMKDIIEEVIKFTSAGMEAE